MKIIDNTDHLNFIGKELMENQTVATKDDNAEKFFDDDVKKILAGLAGTSAVTTICGAVAGTAMSASNGLGDMFTNAAIGAGIGAVSPTATMIAFGGFLASTAASSEVLEKEGCDKSAGFIIGALCNLPNTIGGFMAGIHVAGGVPGNVPPLALTSGLVGAAFGMAATPMLFKAGAAVYNATHKAVSRKLGL